MIYLFDNCYLSTTNTVLERSKQIWVGDFNYDSDVNIDHSFDIHKKYKTITTTELDSLFQEIHDTFPTEKVVIYTDNEYFSYIYYFFFRGIMSKAGVDSMFDYDMKKENYGLGSEVYGLYVTGSKDINKVELTPEGKKPRTFSKFSPLVKNIRIEVAYVNALLGDTASMEYCIDRCMLIWKGLPAFRAKYAEQTLPALLSNEQYTIENLTNPEFIKGFVSSFSDDDFIPRDKLDRVRQIFNFDYVCHFLNVINENNLPDLNAHEVWINATMFKDKREFVEKYLLDPSFPIKMELLFPSISDFNSVNPIFWNEIKRHHNDTSWLAKYGTDNQANGTL